MYNFLEKRKVKSFRISSNQVSYINEENILFFNDIQFANNISDPGYLLAGNYFFYSDNLDYETRLVNLANNDVTKIGFVSPHFQTYNGIDFIANEYQDLISFKTNLILFNISNKSKSVISENIGFGVKLRINENLIINVGKTTLRSLSLLTGEYEWEIDLSRYEKTNKILEVCNEELWVICANKWLLGIDINTGKINKTIKFGALKEEITDLGILNEYLDVEKGEIHFLNYRYYYRIDLKTGQLICFEELPMKRLESIQLATFYQNNFYFIGAFQTDSKGSTGTFVGVFNTESRKIEWLQALNLSECWVNQAPQVSENKLYVLDTCGTLHVFEKEEEEEVI